MKAAEDIVKNYKGAFPDVHGRTPWKTWDELAECMRSDIESYASLRASEAIREHKELIKTELYWRSQFSILQQQYDELSKTKSDLREQIEQLRERIRMLEDGLIKNK
jgi:hypothetical protein